MARDTPILTTPEPGSDPVIGAEHAALCWPLRRLRPGGGGEAWERGLFGVVFIGNKGPPRIALWLDTVWFPLGHLLCSGLEVTEASPLGFHKMVI